MSQRFAAIRSVGLTLTLIATWVAQFEGLRGLLWWRNRDLAGDADWTTLLTSFAVGLKFDLALAAYLTIPLALLALAFRAPRTLMTVSLLLSGVLVVLGVAETEFYREFYTRYNSLALQYWSQPSTVLKMIWHGFPVISLLSMAGCLIAIQAAATRFAVHRWQAGEIDRWPGVAAFALLCPLLFIAARGGVRGSPLEWGDAVHSDSMFANHLAQNGLWTLAKAVQERCHGGHEPLEWPEPMSLEAAQTRTRELLETSHQARVKVTAGRPNVVVIIMESFSARFVGAVGSDDDYTPEFNRLAEDGVLFDRCFSAGTHTHQANVAVLGGFPNLPHHEALMEDYALGTQPLHSLPRALKQQGYSTTYLYNGDFAWENMGGFFRIQGIDRFIGRQDFPNANYAGRTWGVNDRDLFERANREFAQAREPFFAAVLTLSNHAPFELPQPLPFPEVTDQGSMNQRLNGIRYADWALGQFFAQAQREEYFKNTLFVLVGDHGFSVAPILTELRLLRFHVPLLFYAPGLLAAQPQRIHSVASQNDVIPTVLGLLGISDGQSWGRDLLAVPPDDPGLAFFKPSEASGEMGCARGDLLLVRSADGKFHGYRYSLGFPPRVDPLAIAETPQLQRMQREMQAFVTSANEALETRHVHRRGD